MTISERMFYIMQEKKLTQQEFADQTGIPVKTIGTWKMRGSNPPADKLPIIAEVLGVSIAYLVTGKEEAPALSTEAIDVAREWQALDKKKRVIIQAEIYKATLENESNEFAEEWHIEKKAT